LPKCTGNSAMRLSVVRYPVWIQMWTMLRAREQSRLLLQKKKAKLLLISVSIRWTGFVLSDVVETVTFCRNCPAAEGIDGAKLSIRGNLIVDTTISNEIQSGTIFASAAASLYSVVLEFRASTGTCTHFPCAICLRVTSFQEVHHVG